MKSNIARPTAGLHIDILLYPGSMLGIALAFVDLLKSANTLATLRQGANAGLITWRFVDQFARPLSHPIVDPSWDVFFHAYRGIKSDLLSAGHGESTVRACFVPPFHTLNVPALRESVRTHSQVSRSVARQLNAGRRIFVLGNGAWFAAGTVQATNRKFSVPWYFLAAFMTDFPLTEVIQGGESVQDGPFVSAGTMDALIPATLHLLECAYDNDFIQSLRVALTFNAKRQLTVVSARQDGTLSPTRDSTISLATDWLEQHVSDPYDLKALALACSVSTRTLLRHFSEVVNMSPLEYLQRLRCDRACVLLETTLYTTRTIAQECGYVNASAFGKVFTRYVGMSPRAYRLRRTMRAPRKRWKSESIHAQLRGSSNQDRPAPPTDAPGSECQTPPVRR